MNLRSLYLSPEGRINRKPYWLGTLLLLVFYFIAAGLVSLVFYMGGTTADGGIVNIPNATAVVGGLLATAVFVVYMVSVLMVAVKRCHDRDRSGWFILAGLIPVIGPIWLLVELGFLPGTPGPNRFGPDPLPLANAVYSRA